MESINRRNFIGKAAIAGACAGFASAATFPTVLAHPIPQKNGISLAAWSLIRSFRAGVWKLTDLHKICREDFNLDGLEYVNNFFESPRAGYLNRLNKNAKEFGIKNVLIMVDEEGNMAAKDKAERMQAAINHRKWIEIAAFLECHTIRCNARGAGNTPAEDPDAIKRAAESFTALVEYAKEFKINVVIENHGGISSDPEWLPALCREIDSPHFGILPDFGNYIQGVDFAEAVKKAMPYAKGVSVKAAWMTDGTHVPHWDLEACLKAAKDSGYQGFWGIESSLRRPRPEGQQQRQPGAPIDAEAVKQDDWKAVKLTRDAIRKAVFA
jgi:sugar phosphate isomerase/epimerase